MLVEAEAKPAPSRTTSETWRSSATSRGPDQWDAAFTDQTGHNVNAGSEWDCESARVAPRGIHAWAVAHTPLDGKFMMDAAVRCQALVGLLMLATACSNYVPQPIAPSAPLTASTSNANATSTPQNASEFVPRFPAISRPARVYVGTSSAFTTYHGSPLSSRYVLYDDGTFVLQYSSINYPFFEYPGSYNEVNSLMTFDFGPSWDGAKGVLNGTSLRVQYNTRMQMSDFEDGIYTATSP